MTALIYRISGVDPADFQRELAGAGDERFKSDYDRPAADNDAGAATHSPDENPDAPSSGEALADSPIGESSIGASNDPVPQAAGADATHSEEATKLTVVSDAETDSTGDPASNSAASAPNTPETATEQRANVLPQHEVGQAAETRATDQATVRNAGVTGGESAAKATGEGDGAVSPPVAELSEEDRTWLRDGARMMLAAQPEPSAEAKDVLFRQVKSIIMIMPKAASADARNRMEQVKQHCMGVCRGEADLDVPLVARTALATVAEITPAPVSMGRKAQ